MRWETVGFVYAYPTGFRGKYDLGRDPNVSGNSGHSVCKHSHTTDNAAIRCAQKMRAAYRKGQKR